MIHMKPCMTNLLKAFLDPLKPKLSLTFLG